MTHDVRIKSIRTLRRQMTIVLGVGLWHLLLVIRNITTLPCGSIEKIPTEIEFAFSIFLLLLYMENTPRSERYPCCYFHRRTYEQHSSQSCMWASEKGE